MHDTTKLLLSNTTDVLFNPNFNNALWREALSKACQTINKNHIGLEVINPFGFEVLEDKHFLSRRLRRFYCYLGAPKELNLNGDEVVSQYREALFNELRKLNTKMLEDFVVIIENRNVYTLKDETYVCKPTDKLLDIQLRSLEKDLLTDYANYIITTLDSLYSEKGEVKGYRTDKKHRWRLYQFYTMQEALFGYLIPPMSAQQYQLHSQLSHQVSNMIQLFYLPELAKGEPDILEKRMLNDLIFPRVRLIRDAINNTDPAKRITVESNAYHWPDKLELSLDRNIYFQAMKKIKNSYLSFF